MTRVGKGGLDVGRQQRQQPYEVMITHTNKHTGRRRNKGKNKGAGGEDHCGAAYIRYIIYYILYRI